MNVACWCLIYLFTYFYLFIYILIHLPGITVVSFVLISVVVAILFLIWHEYSVLCIINVLTVGLEEGKKSL